MTVLAAASGVSVNAAGGANGILVLAALLLFAVAAFWAITVQPRNWPFILTSAGLGVFMAALLVGS